MDRPGAPGPVRYDSAGLLVTRHPRPPAPTGALPPRQGLRPRPRPRPEPQIAAGTRERGEARRAGGGRQLRTGGRGVGLPGARRPGWPGREASGWAARARLDGSAPPGQHRPLRAPPPPSRSPHPRPGSSTQTFRPARSLLRARRLPLQPGSFRTFRPAPSPRPPFLGPPRGSLGPGGAARPERPRELGPGKPGGRREEAPLGRGGLVGRLGWQGGRHPRGTGSPSYCPAGAGAPDWGAGKFRGKGENLSGKPRPPLSPPPPPRRGRVGLGRWGSRGDRVPRAVACPAVRAWGSGRGSGGRTVWRACLPPGISYPGRPVPGPTALWTPGPRAPGARPASAPRRPRARPPRAQAGFCAQCRGCADLWRVSRAKPRAPAVCPLRGREGLTFPSVLPPASGCRFRVPALNAVSLAPRGSGFGAFSSPHFLRALV